MKHSIEIHRKLFALLGELRYDKEERAELAKTYGSETGSTSDLNDAQARLMISYLQSVKGDSIKKMRSKIINIAKDIGLTKNGEIDWQALNNFLNKKFKKPLHQLTRQELPNAVTAMEKWRDTNMKKELGI